MILTKADADAMHREIEELRKLSVSDSILDPMESSIHYALEAHNGIPDEDRVKYLAISTVKQNIGLLRFFATVYEERIPRKGIEKTAYILKPFAWPISVFMSVALFSSHFNDVVSFVRFLLKI